MQWLVDLGEVEVEGPDEFVAGEDRDSDAVLEHGDRQLLVAAADLDAQLGADGAGWSGHGDAAAGADTASVGLDLAGQRPLSGAGLDAGGEHCRGGLAVVRAVRSAGVVVLSEDSKISIERGQGAVGAVDGLAGPQPLLQRLPEPFDLAAGLRVIRGGGDRLAAQRGQVRLERGRFVVRAALGGVVSELIGTP